MIDIINNFYNIIDKEMSDLAYEQSKNLELRQSSNEKEKDILRAALEESQIENDEKLLIGKLHEHIIALQLKEDSLKKEMESLKTKCINLENKVVVVRIKQLYYISNDNTKIY